jgi:hypothetical protein
MTFATYLMDVVDQPPRLACGKYNLGKKEIMSDPEFYGSVPLIDAVTII